MSKRVNLLPREGFEYTTFGKIVVWSLSAGRVIVILTELVVILAFISRFWLDRQLTDLNEANTSKKRQIEAAAKFEADFRKAQDRLTLYKNLTSSQLGGAQTVQEITSSLPSGVTLSSISLAEKDIVLTGNALSEEGLAGFLQALGTLQKLKDTKLETVSLSTEGQQSLVFTIKGSLKI